MKRILIIDDDRINQNILAEAFSKKDYEVISVYDSRASLKKTAQYKPDLIILDLLMPSVNGFEVLKMIKKKATISKIPVLVLTALSEEGSFKESLSLGAEECLLKTDYTPSQLVTKISKRLSNV